MLLWRYTCILEEHFVHVCGCILEELVMRIEDNDRDFTVAQNAQLVGFFHQTKLSLGESDLTIPLVCNSGNRDLLTTHFFWFYGIEVTCVGKKKYTNYWMNEWYDKKIYVISQLLLIRYTLGWNYIWSRIHVKVWMYSRCGRVVTDFPPYPKFSKSLLSW